MKSWKQAHLAKDEDNHPVSPEKALKLLTRDPDRRAGGQRGGGGSHTETIETSFGQQTVTAQQQRARQMGRRNRRAGRVCWICNDPDHIARDCPSRPQNAQVNCQDEQEEQDAGSTASGRRLSLFGP